MTARKVWSGGAWVTLGGGAAGGPTQKAPSAISGLVFHIDAETSLTSGSITTWTELVSSNSPTQATSGARPTVTTSYFGGKKAALFDGSDDRLVAPSVGMTVVNDFCIAVVCRPLAATANRVPFHNGVGATNGYGCCSRTNSQYIGVLVGGVAFYSTGQPGGEVDQIIVVRRTAGTWNIRANGMDGTTLPTFSQPTPGAPSTPASAVSVGSSYSGDPWNGAVAAGAMWNVAVSDADVGALEAYWSDRYNVPVHTIV